MGLHCTLYNMYKFWKGKRIENAGSAIDILPKTKLYPVL